MKIIRINKKTLIIFSVLFVLILGGVLGFIIWNVNNSEQVGGMNASAAGWGEHSTALGDGPRTCYSAVASSTCAQNVYFDPSFTCDRVARENPGKVVMALCDTPNEAMCWISDDLSQIHSDCGCTSLGSSVGMNTGTCSGCGNKLWRYVEETKTYNCGEKGCTTDSDCIGWSPDQEVECDESTDPANNVCRRIKCPDGQHLKDGSLCECEADTSETVSCGQSCGDNVLCEDGYTCTNGTCQISSCPSGQELSSDKCSCTQIVSSCGESCANGESCSTGSTCISGVCQIESCPSGQHLTSDKCGCANDAVGCGNSCDSSTPCESAYTCTSGTCQLASCPVGQHLSSNKCGCEYDSVSCGSDCSVNPCQDGEVCNSTTLKCEKTFDYCETGYTLSTDKCSCVQVETPQTSDSSTLHIVTVAGVSLLILGLLVVLF